MRIPGAFCLALVFGLTGCSHSVTTTTPPPPTVKGVAFTWKIAGLPSLPDCTKQAAEPCLRYDLTDNATKMVIAHPEIGETSFILTPAPATWPRSYTLTLELVSNDGSTTPCAHPPVTVVALP